MRKYYNDLLLMFQVLTRVPINKNLPCEMGNFKNGANFFAFIGLCIGLCQYTLFIGLNKIISIEFVVIAIIVFEILITGALHIDGLGDTCDGFFAFKGKDKIIEIMKDSRIGTFGCIAILLNILIKYQGYLLIENNLKGILIVPMISRFSMILLSYVGKPAKKEGSGNLFISTVTLKELIINTLFVIVVGFLFDFIFKTLILFFSAMIMTIFFNLFCNHKIKGVTGDSLGANNELIVMLSLILLASA